MTAAVARGWLGSCGAGGDLDGKPTSCHPGHHRDAVRIAVDGAVGPENDGRVLGGDADDGQLNGRRTSLYREDPGNRPASAVLPDAVRTERDRRMTAGVEEQARAHLGSRMKFLVEKLDAETSASTRESSGGSAMVITPRVTLSLPRTLPSPNMCLVSNVTDDPAGSIAYRPAGGACTAVLVVDMTAVPSWWIGAREQGAVALRESPGPEHALRSGRSRCSRRPEVSFASRTDRIPPA